MKRLTPHTIRGKLLLWFMTTTTLTFLVLGILVSIVIWQVLHDQIDHHLHTVITEAEQVVATFPATERNTLLQSFASQRGMTVTILAPDGFPVLQTNSPDVASLSQTVLQRLLKSTPSNTLAPVHFNINDVRFATKPVMLPEGQGLVAVGYSLSVVDQTFKQLIAIIAFMLVVALGLSTYGIRILLAKYLKPVETIAAKTNAITQSNYLSMRVPMDQETTELVSLTSAINGMLDRLDTFFKNEHQFFSDAAHTLKTPLAIFRSYLETTGDTKEKDMTIGVVDQATETIQDLILLSRMNSNELVSNKPFLLSDQMKQLAEIAETLALDKEQRVRTSIKPGITIKANETLINRALSNVVQNAINYTAKRGIISMTLASDVHQAVITISDTGVGIPAKERSRIFKRFYRGSNVRNSKGTGLGLAITKAIVEAHHGKILLESRLGHGTTVTITIPIIG